MIFHGAQATNPHPPIHTTPQWGTPLVADTTAMRQVISRDPGQVARDGLRLPATLVREFGADWYDRIHISVGELALGNLISEQTRQVWIWNAYDQVKTLQQIEVANGEGVVLYGQNPPPLKFGGRQQRTWNLRVATDGPPVINAYFYFEFVDGTTRTLHVTGTRIVAWATLPDWSNVITERLEWKTDLIQSYTRKEQRRQNRLSPRRTLEFSVMESGQSRRIMEANLWGWGSRVWALPIVPNGIELQQTLLPGSIIIPVSDALRLDFHDGGLAILIEDNRTYEVVEIDTVTNDGIVPKRPINGNWQAGQVIYPAKTARITDKPKLSQFSHDTTYGSVSFQVDEANDYAAAWTGPMYRGWPVIEARPDFSSDPSITYDRNLLTFDNDTGKIYSVDPSGLPEPITAHARRFQDRADRYDFLTLAYVLRGRLSNAWVPTWRDDVVLTAIAASNAISIDVEFGAFTSQYQNQVGRKDIRIEVRTGQVFYRRVTQTQVVDENTERLGIDAALGIEVRPEDVVQICFLSLSRSDSDAIEIQHWTYEVADASLTWRGFNNDE